MDFHWHSINIDVWDENSSGAEELIVDLDVYASDYSVSQSSLGAFFKAVSTVEQVLKHTCLRRDENLIQITAELGENIRDTYARLFETTCDLLQYEFRCGLI